MMAENRPRIACPACGATYGWKPEVAGRKVRCKCDAVIRLPQQAGGAATIERPAPNTQAPAATSPTIPAVKPAPAAEDSTYSLALPDLDEIAPKKADAPAPVAPPPGSALCPSCQAPVKPTAVICINCGMNFRQGKKVKSALVATGNRPLPAVSGAIGSMSAAVDPNEPQRRVILDYQLPLNLVFLGIVGLVAHAVYFIEPGDTEALGALIVHPIIATPAYMLIFLITSKWMGIDFGQVGPRWLKSAALALAPIAAADLIAEAVGAPLGAFAGFVVAVALTWGLLSLLFSLSVIDVLKTLLVSLVVQVALAFCIGAVLFGIMAAVVVSALA